MPELPDIESYRITLTRYLPGARIVDVEVRDASVLRNISAQDFRNQMIGAIFQTPRRQGKWSVLPTDGPTMLIHNGMTGHPYFIPAGTRASVSAMAIVTIGLSSAPSGDSCTMPIYASFGACGLSRATTP